MVFTLLSFLLVISISVLIHELGHFWAARLSGVRVNEFSLGMGPRSYRSSGLAPSGP